MDTSPEYDAAILGLKRGTLSRNQGGEKAEQRLGLAYDQMRQRDPSLPRLRIKYQGRDYKSAGTSKGGMSTARPKRWLGKNAPPSAGKGN